MFCYAASKSAIFYWKTCKSAIVMVIIETKVGFGLTAISSSKLVLSLPRKVSSLALDRVADLGKVKAASAF